MGNGIKKSSSERKKKTGQINATTKGTKGTEKETNKAEAREKGDIKERQGVEEKRNRR